MEDNNIELLRTKIKELKNYYSAEELALRVGVDSSTINRFINGASPSKLSRNCYAGLAMDNKFSFSEIKEKVRANKDQLNRNIDEEAKKAVEGYYILFCSANSSMQRIANVNVDIKDEIIKIKSHYPVDTYYIPIRYHRKLKNYDKMWNGIQPNTYPMNLLDQSILNTQNNLVVLGDSGFGKTTFAHWVCGLWKLNQIATSPVLLYIDLKAGFFNVQSDLESYLYQQYNIEMGLQEDPDKRSYYLMLDSFEVLTARMKSSILEQLKTISEAYKWMILCRPYAFSDCKEPSATYLKIDGFDSTQQEAYVRHHHIPEPVIQDLKTKFSQNKEHAQLASSPWHLEMICRLVLNDPDLLFLYHVKSSVQLHYLYQQL